MLKVRVPGRSGFALFFGWTVTQAAPRFRAIALEALGQLHQERQQPAAAAPPIAEAQELRQALSVNAR
jgi:hypothetical protein